MGPLKGLKVIEIKGIGPAPYAGMLLADMGAEVVVVERESKSQPTWLPSEKDAFSRGKKSIALDLKSEAGVGALLKLIEGAAALLEGFRPGVAERLGFGPDVCLERNPKLVYGRMTGWGQYGPLAHAAGHDINYIAITGALAAVGTKERPLPPVNLVGDLGGGSMFLIMGMLAALLEVEKTGKGQVVDAAITDGAISLMSMIYSVYGIGGWKNARESNFIDGGAHFYSAYKTADDKFISVGSVEPQFYAELVGKVGIAPEIADGQINPATWEEKKQQFAEIFKTKTRAEWCEILEGTDACFAPVLDFLEAPEHPHNKAREAFVDVGGLVQPAPAPKFSGSPCAVPEAPRAEGIDTLDVLADWGFDKGEITALKDSGVLT